MTIQDHIEAIADYLDNGGNMVDFMRDAERKKGNAIVRPGEVSWLLAADWPLDIVVSLAGRRVRVVAIYAKHPGQGAFRRLVASIQEAGLIPCVIAPTNEMRATLTRWKWRRRNHGVSFETHEERWEPRKAR